VGLGAIGAVVAWLAGPAPAVAFWLLGLAALLAAGRAAVDLREPWPQTLTRWHTRLLMLGLLGLMLAPLLVWLEVSQWGPPAGGNAPWLDSTQVSLVAVAVVLIVVAALMGIALRARMAGDESHLTGRLIVIVVVLLALYGLWRLLGTLLEPPALRAFLERGGPYAVEIASWPFAVLLGFSAGLLAGGLGRAVGGSREGVVAGAAVGVIAALLVLRWLEPQAPPLYGWGSSSVVAAALVLLIPVRVEGLSDWLFLWPAVALLRALLLALPLTLGSLLAGVIGRSQPHEHAR
jgi:hypothetical protein